MVAQLPYGAAEIVALRSAGKRPADMVLVSLIGQLRESSPMVIAKPRRTYDWRFVVDLQILIVATTNTPNLADIVNVIDSAGPASLSVWFADKQNGTNVLLDHYRPPTKNGRSMGVEQRVNLAGLGSNDSLDDCLLKIAGQVKRRASGSAGGFDMVLNEMATAGFQRLLCTAWGAA